MDPDPMAGHVLKFHLELGDEANDAVKRPRGRPKGSGLKRPGEELRPKVKRPVGRPRKDGLPAGSAPSSKKLKNKTSGSNLPDPDSQDFEQKPRGIAGWSMLAFESPPALLLALVEALNDLPEEIPMLPGLLTAEDAFKAHLGCLAPTSNTPALYSVLKTFWVPSASLYLALTSTSPAPSPHRFLYWDPLPLVFNGIPCPECSQPLHNNGPIKSGPIKVFDLDKPFYIIACEYVCPNARCAKSFASTAASILCALPVKLRDDFPAKLLPHEGNSLAIWNWAALGVSIRLWKMTISGMSIGVSKAVLLSLIQSTQSLHEAPFGLKAVHDEPESPSTWGAQLGANLQPTPPAPPPIASSSSAPVWHHPPPPPAPDLVAPPQVHYAYKAADSPLPSSLDPNRPVEDLRVRIWQPPVRKGGEQSSASITSGE